MRCAEIHFRKAFEVVLSNAEAQVAQMTLRPGSAEGGAGNRHRGSDQWLYVISGSGKAIVNGHSYDLNEGTLMLIERGDEHEIRCSGRNPLHTISFYVPPAYDADGEELPAGKAEP